MGTAVVAKVATKVGTVVARVPTVALLPLPIRLLLLLLLLRLRLSQQCLLPFLLHSLLLWLRLLQFGTPSHTTPPVLRQLVLHSVGMALTGTT